MISFNINNWVQSFCWFVFDCRYDLFSEGYAPVGGLLCTAIHFIESINKYNLHTISHFCTQA